MGSHQIVWRLPNTSSRAANQNTQPNEYERGNASIRSCRSNGRANPLACGCCQSARVKCVMDEPYSSDCCKRCLDKGIACLPHEGKRKPRQATNKRERSVAGSDSEPDVNQVELQAERGRTLSYVHSSSSAAAHVSSPLFPNPSSSNTIVTPYTTSHNLNLAVSTNSSSSILHHYPDESLYASLYEPMVQFCSQTQFPSLLQDNEYEVLTGMPFLEAQYWDEYLGVTRPPRQFPEAYQNVGNARLR